MCLWKLGICQGSTSPENLFLFHISEFFSLFFLFFSLSLSPFPSLLYTNLQVSVDPPGGARESKRDHTWNRKKDLNFPEGKGLFCWEESLQKKQSSPKWHKTPCEGRVLDHTEGRTEEKGRGGVWDSGWYKTAESLISECGLGLYSRGSRADLRSLWVAHKLLRRRMPWWSWFWPWCFRGAGRRRPRTQSWGQWDHPQALHLSSKWWQGSALREK